MAGGDGSHSMLRSPSHSMQLFLSGLGASSFQSLNAVAALWPLSDCHLDVTGSRFLKKKALALRSFWHESVNQKAVVVNGNKLGAPVGLGRHKHSTSALKKNLKRSLSPKVKLWLYGSRLQAQAWDLAYFQDLVYF